MLCQAVDCILDLVRFRVIGDRAKCSRLCWCPIHLRFGCFARLLFFFQAEDGIRDLVRSRGLGDVYKRQVLRVANSVDSELKVFGVLSSGF